MRYSILTILIGFLLIPSFASATHGIPRCSNAIYPTGTLSMDGSWYRRSYLSVSTTVKRIELTVMGLGANGLELACEHIDFVADKIYTFAGSVGGHTPLYGVFLRGTVYNTSSMSLSGERKGGQEASIKGELPCGAFSRHEVTHGGITMTLTKRVGCTK